jgi:hypothetical protein
LIVVGATRPEPCVTRTGVRGPDAQRAAEVAFHVTDGPHSSAMRDVTSPVLDRLDAGRGQLHALQVLLGLSFLLLIL